MSKLPRYLYRIDESDWLEADSLDSIKSEYEKDLCAGETIEVFILEQVGIFEQKMQFTQNKGKKK